MSFNRANVWRCIAATGAAVCRARAAWRSHRRARLVALGVVALVLSLAGGYALAAKHVTLVVDGVETPCFTLSFTVRAILADAGIDLHPRDRVDPLPDDRVGEGAVITVTKAFGVTIAADGQQFASMTAQPTVGAAVTEAGVALGPADRTEPAADASPAPGIAIQVVRVTTEYDSALWRIPRKVTTREDESLALGLTRVVSKGKDGVEEVTFCTTYENGVQIARKITERVVVEDPVPESVVVGTSGTIVRDGVTIEFRKAMSMTATAYYWGPECTGKYADGFTYCGLPATKGVIAVDPRVIPLWTKVYVDGYGFAVAGDVGSAIKGKIIDLCYDTYPEALAWGRRKVTLYILK